MPMIPVRRIVTAHDAHGKAVVTSDGKPPAVLELSASGTYFTEIWKTDSSPAPVDNGPDPTTGPMQMAPAHSGSVIRFVQIAPESQTQLPSDPTAMRAHFAELGSAEAATGNSSSPHPFMHRTETVDYGIVLRGEVTLILDDSETLLKPGDVVIQRGTNHAWSNRGNEPCQIAFILLDGRYSDEVASTLAHRQEVSGGAG